MNEHSNMYITTKINKYIKITLKRINSSHLINKHRDWESKVVGKRDGGEKESSRLVHIYIGSMLERSR